MTVNELIGKLNALPEEQKEMEVRFCEIINEYDDKGFYAGDIFHSWKVGLDDCDVVVYGGEVRICIEED